uniref:spartin-like isoform X2 n=1 Tax=Doryrhamphus excisus TaxID=161450 RepID=UPI0025ADE3DD|nr:spartin-like isoform X2 [Doryrhamphus excisus]
MEKARQDAFDHARLEVIKDGYERGFECINKGLTADEAGDTSQALELYKRGRQHLLRAISVPSRGDECVGHSWESARQMQQKMQETLDNITTRLTILEASGQPSQNPYPKLPAKEKPERPVPPTSASTAGACSPGVLSPSRLPLAEGDHPPAYSPQAADGHISISYGTESGELSLVSNDFYDRASNSTSSSESIGEDAEELLYISQGVQIFFVTPEGQVSAPSYPGYLRLVRFASDHSERMPDRPQAFLQAADEAGEHVNLSHKVSIATPDEAAAVVEEEDDQALPVWSEKMASGILTGASWLSWGLVKGAEFTGKAIHKGACKLREHITPEDKPAHVSPAVSKGLHVAKQATGGAVKVSQFLVDGVCTVAGCVGRELAPHVKKHGGKLIPESMRKDKDGRSNIDGAMVVAASGVQGFATMWTGLEVAAKNITTSVASETVTTVKHKYGAAAGQATDHAVNSAINMGVTAFNIDNLGIKAVVKKTGKQTAQALLEDYKLQEKGDGQKKVEKSDK